MHSLIRTALLGVAAVGIWGCGDTAKDPLHPSTQDQLELRARGNAAVLDLASAEAQEGDPGTPVVDAPRVRVLDRWGRGVARQEVRFTVTAGDGSALPAVATTDRDGYATTAWTLGPEPALNGLRADVPSLGSVTFQADSRDTSPPPSIIVLQGDHQTDTVGQTLPLPLEVQVADENGEALVEREVAWRVVSGDGSVEARSSVTDVDGLVRATWTLGPTVGPQAVAVEAGAASVLFTAEAVEEPAPEGETQGGQAGPVAPLGANEPAGYSAIIGRNFESMADDASDGRGAGSFPWKTGGSEGWDDVERRFTLWSAVSDPTDPVAGGGGSTGTVAEVVYDGVRSNTGPGAIQTLFFNNGAYNGGKGYDIDEMYTYHTLKLSPDYQVGPVGNKLMFHSLGTYSNTFFNVLHDNGGDESFTIGANFQGTPDNGLGFFWSNEPTYGTNIRKDVWYSIETLSVRNSAAGVADGVFRMWVNGVLVVERTDVLYTDSMADYFQGVHWSPTCGSCDDLVQPFGFRVGVSYVSGKQADTQGDPQVDPTPVTSVAPLGANEPAGYSAIIGRNFESMADDVTDGRGAGSFPWKTGGSEGWDDVERRFTLWSAVSDPTDPVAGGGGSTGTVAEVVYDGVRSNTGPGAIQTLFFNNGVYNGGEGYDIDEMYTYHTLKLSPDYQVGPVGNKLMFHSLGTYSNTFFNVLHDNGGDESFTIGANFQGTPDNGLGFFWSNEPTYGTNIRKDVWYSIETQAVRNSAAGVADGVFRMWVNGVLVVERTDVAYTDSMADYFQGVHWSPTCGSCDDLVQPFGFRVGVSYVSGKQAG